VGGGGGGGGGGGLGGGGWGGGWGGTAICSFATYNGMGLTKTQPRPTACPLRNTLDVIEKGNGAEREKPRFNSQISLKVQGVF